MNLGVLISELPREIRRRIVWHVGDLGMMITRHVLLDRTIDTDEFETDLDVYLSGLKFFLWCRDNINLKSVVSNARRSRDPEIINWLCEFHFKLIEPDDMLRDTLIKNMRRVLVDDCGNKRVIMIHGFGYNCLVIRCFLRQFTPCVDEYDTHKKQIDVKWRSENYHRTVVYCVNKTHEEIKSMTCSIFDNVQFLIESSEKLDPKISDKMIVITINTDYPFHHYDEYRINDNVLLERYILDY